MCDANNYEYYKKNHICVRCGQRKIEKNTYYMFMKQRT